MDEILKFFQADAGRGDQLGALEVVVAITLCLACTTVIGLVYRFTHKGANYSQSYVASLVLMGMVTTLIMIVIGSNIARAFSLVGALSIIRFRNAVKETRDVAFIYYVMAIAMACGTRFYLIAIIACAIFNAVILILHFTNFGATRIRPERLLTVQLRPGLEPETVLGPVLQKLFSDHTIISVESVRQGMYTEALFSVSPKRDVTPSQVLTEVAEANDNLKVTYNFSTNTDDL